MDGIGGCLKSKAADESKKKGVKNPINNAKTFQEFIIRKNYKTIPILITTEEIDKTASDLDDRWKSSQTVEGTQKFHHFEVNKEDMNFIQVKHFSSSDTSMKIRIKKAAAKPKRKSNKNK